MKILQTALLLLVAISGSAFSQDKSHEEWVEQSLAHIESVKPGMTRAQLLKVFSEEGGLSTPSHRTYVYQECHYFKVDVDFSIKPGQASENPTDEIARISVPYIALSILD